MRKSLPLLVALLCFGADDKNSGLPLKPDRKIEFSTNEGTWLSLDVSHDGGAILFDLLGDLYTLPIEGGRAKCIMSGLPFDSEPVYSPEGDRIAFLSDRDGAENLWIAKADGSEPRQLSKDKDREFASPRWTPDGKYVLVSRSVAGLGGHEIWMYNVLGGSGVQVTKSFTDPKTPRNEKLNFRGPIASPDGRYFYYGRRKAAFTYNSEMPTWQIVRRDRTTGDEDVITDAPGSAFRPVLSPDGKQLVYGTRFETETGLRIRSLDTGQERWLKYPVQRDDQESRATRDVLPGYAFTPDGKDVLAAYAGKIHRISVATGEDRIVPFEAAVSLDAGAPLRFSYRVDEGPVRARLIQEPSQSPDGRLLVFSALTHLYITDLPNGTPRRLVNGSAHEYQPAWSPDGQWIAYVSWTHEGGHIWKTRADGQGQPQQLTASPAFYREPVWTSDGSRIVALRASTQDRDTLTGLDVIWIAGEGGSVHLIVPARGAGRPHFSKDKDRILVYSDQGLISLRFDGTDRRTHLKVVGKNLTQTPDPPPARDVRLSPDGQQALALVNHDLYLLDVPVAGGEAPRIDVSSPSVPVKKLTDIGADSFGWADQGKTVVWSLGASYFRQPVSTISFESDKTDKDVDQNKAEAGSQANVAQSDKKLKYEEIAITIERPRHTPKGTVVLRGARVITMRGDEVLPAADVVVTDNRITSVGKRGPVSAGAKVIEIRGATVMPGIVDVHAHWFEIRRSVLDLTNWPFLANLAHGVTTGRDPQTGTNDALAYQDLVETGEIIVPRAYSTGPGIFSNTDMKSLDDARYIVSRYKKYYRTNTVKSYIVGNRKQRQWMVQACRENEIMPTTEGALDLKLDLTHAIDGFSGNEHALPIVPLAKDVAETFARSGIAYTPTLLVAYGGPWAENYFYETTEVHDNPKLQRFVPHRVLDQKTLRRPWFRPQEHIFPKLSESAAKIARAGGRVVIGGHGQLQGLQCHWEMWALATGGLSNHEVLRSATLTGAQTIGLDQDLGSIEPGKLADLIVLDRNPLDDIRNTTSIRYVMKNGELFEGSTLDQIWPVRKPLPEQWWWKDNPKHSVPSVLR